MQRLNTNQIIDFLSSTQLFSHLEPSVLKEIASVLKVIPLKGKQLLMRQNEAANSLYIVESGRLKATTLSENGKQIIVGEIGRGEVVGEIALFTGGTRTATVHAIRDSTLLEFTTEAFEQFIKKFPSVGMDIAKFCLKRLTKTQQLKKRSNITTVAFVPAGKNPIFSAVVAQLAKLFETPGTHIHFNQKTFNQLFGQDAAQAQFDSDQHMQIVTWLHQQELKYRYVIYEADTTLTQWTLRCLRQADQIILIGLFNEDPALNEIEEELFNSIDQTSATIDLALLHKTSARPVGTTTWLNKRRIDDHYHIQLDSLKDYAKLVRFATGNATGLVLSGGGYRTFAYIGLFRALEELKINFDFVGGTSAGAEFAALYAKGVDHKEMLNLLKQEISEYKLYTNITLPILSIFSGKFFSNKLHNLFDDIYIEDLWTNFFCVSSNLSENNLKIHGRGLLWKALRASISLPGLLPPVIDENGDMHVDGGVINNLPVDLMRAKLGNGKILAVGLTTNVTNKYTQLDMSVSGWRLLFEKMLGLSKNKKLPNVSEVIISSITLAETLHEVRMGKEADYLIKLDVGHYGLLQLKGFNKLIDDTYEACLKQLSQFFK